MAGGRSRNFGIVAVAAVTLLLATAARAEVVVAINKSAQRMAVFVDGAQKYVWSVSTGVGGGPHNGSYRPQRLERSWYSRKYNRAPMPYSIFFDGNYAIHGTIHVRNLGRRASKGCVRLHPSNAAVLFDLVRRTGMARTRIMVSNADVVVAPVRQVDAPQPAFALAGAASDTRPAGNGQEDSVISERDDTPPSLRASLDQAAIVPAAGEGILAPAVDSAIASARPRESVRACTHLVRRIDSR
jgi:hypothetical protein